MRREPQRPGCWCQGYSFHNHPTMTFFPPSFFSPGLVPGFCTSRNPDLQRWWTSSEARLDLCGGSGWSLFLCSSRNQTVINVGMQSRAGCSPKPLLAGQPGATRHSSRLPSQLLARCLAVPEPWVSISELCGAGCAPAFATSRVQNDPPPSGLIHFHVLPAQASSPF